MTVFQKRTDKSFDLKVKRKNSSVILLFCPKLEENLLSMAVYKNIKKQFTIFLLGNRLTFRILSKIVLPDTR